VIYRYNDYSGLSNEKVNRVKDGSRKSGKKFSNELKHENDFVMTAWNNKVINDQIKKRKESQSLTLQEKIDHDLALKQQHEQKMQEQKEVDLALKMIKEQEELELILKLSMIDQ